jgi:type 1 fimbriae regulatory protein FimB/type 1 fimbriae regulatory protein FimE
VSQVDLSQGLIHVNRLKNGVASVHPLSGQNIRALRKLKRDYPDTQYIFITEQKKHNNQHSSQDDKTCW